MDENPYTAPRTTSDAPPHVRVRTRLGLGNVLFLGLGIIFVLIFASLATSEFDDLLSNVEVIIGLTAILLLGGALIAHGALRSDATIRVVTIVLVSIICLAIVAVVLV